MSNMEISRELQIARSTCSYILRRLEGEGYVVRDESTGKYRVGVKTVVLGREALRELGFRVVSEPTLYRLAIETGLAANLAVLEGSRVVILDRIEGFAFINAAIEESKKNQRHAHVTPPGIAKFHHSCELPVCTTALGKVLLANRPPECVQTFLRYEAPAKKRSKDDLQDLLSELATVREQGYCMMHFEPHSESCALASPILDASNTVRAAVSVSCKIHLPIWSDVQNLSQMVKEAAWEISSKLRYPEVKVGSNGATLQPPRPTMDLAYAK